MHLPVAELYNLGVGSVGKILSHCWSSGRSNLTARLSKICRCQALDTPSTCAFVRFVSTVIAFVQHCPSTSPREKLSWHGSRSKLRRFPFHASRSTGVAVVCRVLGPEDISQLVKMLYSRFPHPLELSFLSFLNSPQCSVPTQPSRRCSYFGATFSSPPMSHRHSSHSLYGSRLSTSHLSTLL